MADLEKLETGIAGLDSALRGGIPRARATLISGGPGCGKTLMGLTFAVHNALTLDRPAVFLAFEELRDDLVIAASNIGLDVQAAIDSGRLALDVVSRDDEPSHEIGEYTLDGLKLRLAHQIDQTDAEIVVLDTIETLFATFRQQEAVRASLIDLFRWLKERGIALVVTAERDGRLFGDATLEEYISDCVILLAQEVVQSVTTRRMRIRKFRGSAHDTAETPFLIGDDGIMVLPIESAGLDHQPLAKKLSAGSDELDRALDGGFRQGSTVLVSGATGTGKTLLAGTIAAANATHGKNSLMVSFEESPAEFLFNAGAIGEQLAEFRNSGEFQIFSARPTQYGLERHLVAIYQMLDEFDPETVIIDPLSSLDAAGEPHHVLRMLIRLIDTIKRRGATAILTTQIAVMDESAPEVPMSSVLDTWLHIERRARERDWPLALTIVKARGIDHRRHPLGMRISSAGIRFGEPDDRD